LILKKTNKINGLAFKKPKMIEIIKSKKSNFDNIFIKK